MFLDEVAHHISSPPANTKYLPIKDPQPSLLQAKEKKLMQKAKKNMRKINFKWAVTHKFKKYDQKLEALTSINVSKAIKKRSCKTTFTKPSTFADDLLDMDLKLKLLNRIHEIKTHPTNQKLYDTLYASIILDQEALDAQNAETSFHKIMILPLIVRGRKGRKDEKMLVNRLNLQEKIKLPWFMLKKTL
ncbi:hypothetical protein Tco_1111472 [Tanacetum coccineum]|uniref:Uncharacterized protein n=1 Tax=Tanacetum coccineum TaxID=301880 RepID=A0ABQ5ILQ8_9ASTR